MKTNLSDACTLSTHIKNSGAVNAKLNHNMGFVKMEGLFFCFFFSWEFHPRGGTQYFDLSGFFFFFFFFCFFLLFFEPSYSIFVFFSIFL